MLKFRKWKSLHKYTFFNYDDQVYSNFIIDFLQMLTPRKIQKGCKIFVEQEEVDELLFVMKGSYAIGFEINKIEKMIIKQNNASVVGGFEFAYNRRSMYIYKSRTEIQG